MFFKFIYHELQLPRKTAACVTLLKVILYSSSVGVSEYMTADLKKLTFEDVLFKNELLCGYFAYISRILEKKRWQQSEHFPRGYERVCEDRSNYSQQIVYWSTNLEWDLTLMTVSNVRYCESHILYRVSWFLLKTMRRRVSDWWWVFGSVVRNYRFWSILEHRK